MISLSDFWSLAARLILATKIGQLQLMPNWKCAARDAALRWTLNYQQMDVTIPVLCSGSDTPLYLVTWSEVSLWDGKRYRVPWPDH